MIRILKTDTKSIVGLYQMSLKQPKKKHNDESILKSKNRIKTTWGIIKKETGNENQHDQINSLRIHSFIYLRSVNPYKVN